MLSSTYRSSTARLWSAFQAQYLFAVPIAVLLPYGFALLSNHAPLFEQQATNSALAAFFAQLAGTWLYRNISLLPGVQSSASIMPALGIPYSAAFFLILLARIPYSRAMLIGSWVLAMAVFYLIYFATQRHQRAVIGVVPGGQAETLYALNGIEWRPLTLTKLPAGCTAVAADLRADLGDAWEKHIADIVLAGWPVHHSKDLAESLTGRTELEHLSENSFGNLGPNLPVQQVKAVIDCLLAVPLLVLISPLLVLTAIAIRLDSPGPVFFRQERVGYRGKPFTVIKFRTMRHGLPTPSDGVDAFITRDGDTRITWLGRFLRRSRIDELPQLVNILMGEMSFIGPRPEASALSQWYEREIPFYRYRHIVVPGISGWAQVNQGHVADLGAVRDKLHYDFYYIKNFSIWLDLLIVARTILTMVTGFGSK